jgi:hypothetical protein
MKSTSPVYGSGPASLGDIFPTVLPEPEKLVYQFVKDATEPYAISFPDDDHIPVSLEADFKQRGPLSLYASKDDPRTIPVVRGWPAYPGNCPGIGVAVGTETEDDQHDAISGGFAGEAFAHDANGNVIGSADYFAEPLYVPVIVELIHENRDERDRLHNELRRLLFPLRRKLLGMDPLIRRVRVDSEKQDTPMDEAPYVLYVSLFTVHVYFEMLEATNVTGTDGIISSLATTVTPLGITDFTQAQLDANQIEVTH